MRANILAFVAWILLGLLCVAGTAGCAIPFFDKDIVIEQKQVPCPLIEPVSICPAPVLRNPRSCRDSLDLNAHYRLIFECQAKEAEKRQQTRAECAGLQ